MRSPRRSVRRAPRSDGVRPPARGEASRAEFGSHTGREPESRRPQVPRHLPPQPFSRSTLAWRALSRRKFPRGDIFSKAFSPAAHLRARTARAPGLTDVRRDRVDCRAASRRPRASDSSVSSGVVSIVPSGVGSSCPSLASGDRVDGLASRAAPRRPRRDDGVSHRGSVLPGELVFSCQLSWSSFRERTREAASAF